MKCGKIPVNKGILIMANKEFKQGQRIYFDLGTDKPKGWAKVTGHQGFVIIIKPEKKIPNYDYTHIYIVDSQVTDPVSKSVPSESVTPEETTDEKV